ncbi:Protein arv1 [Leucoagaricus sp. SymC.cos]|nr:Protein arv1 [Leucoagaricus sp. SymC.cos]
MPICTTCTTYTPFLYTVYESAYNLRLEQCLKCHAFVDPYVEHDSLILLLDLILLKRGVYRHLLYNRGSVPRHATSKPQETAEETDTGYLSRARWIWTIKLGTALVALDACMFWYKLLIFLIRWTHLRPRDMSQDTYAEESLLIFLRVLSGCLAETLAFHTGILLSCFMILRLRAFFKILFSRFRRQPLTSSEREPNPTQEINLSLIPLTLFYSSLTKLFLLFLLTIWTPTSPSTGPSPQQHSQLDSDWLNALLIDPPTAFLTILSDLSKVFDDDKLDREWVIRNVLGGMSAGFGLRVILDIHPSLSTLIILSGWASKTAMAQVVGEWVGGGTQMSQAWLAHSIP